MAQKQMLERSALKQKFDTEYDMLKNEKEEQLNKLIHKFKNKKLELEMQHKQEKLFNDNEHLLKASKIVIIYLELTTNTHNNSKILNITRKLNIFPNTKSKKYLNYFNSILVV